MPVPNEATGSPGELRCRDVAKSGSGEGAAADIEPVPKIRGAPFRRMSAHNFRRVGRPSSGPSSVVPGRRQPLTNRGVPPPVCRVGQTTLNKSGS